MCGVRIESQSGQPGDAPSAAEGEERPPDAGDRVRLPGASGDCGQCPRRESERVASRVCLFCPLNAI